jgi:sugar O-acyltransferase (sialic acid O-acetyltransferase NeuD family)
MTKKSIYAIYGASGFGREVMPLARAQLRRQGQRAELVFIDDAPAAREANGHRVLTYDEFLAAEADERYAAVAIANSAIRQRLSGKLAADGVQIFDVWADNAVVLEDVAIGAGAIICHFTLFSANIRIGKSFHANIYSYVEHDCSIGDYVTFAPAVKCNGNVRIEDHAYIGAGAVIKQGRPGQPLVIGAGAVVGMGAVVTKDVAPGTTVVGNPARVMNKV